MAAGPVPGGMYGHELDMKLRYRWWMPGCFAQSKDPEVWFVVCVVTLYPNRYVLCRPLIWFSICNRRPWLIGCLSHFPGSVIACMYLWRVKEWNGFMIWSGKSTGNTDMMMCWLAGTPHAVIVLAATCVMCLCPVSDDYPFRFCINAISAKRKKKRTGLTYLHQCQKIMYVSWACCLLEMFCRMERPRCRNSAQNQDKFVRNQKIRDNLIHRLGLILAIRLDQ
jgi:hypothetical protein